MLENNNELICYKEIEIDRHGKLKFFLEKHSTKEGTWGELLLKEGAIDFVFMNGHGEELSRCRVDHTNPQLIIPPASWHKIALIDEKHFAATIKFYCIRQRYFNKKYGTGRVHNDLLYVYQTYLSHLQNASILDVGCGSGRNLLYLAERGHSVKGIDCNQNALSTIEEIAEKEQLSNISTLLCDLNQAFELESKGYDLVLSTVTLQFINPQRIPVLLETLQEITRKGGYHFLVTPVQSKSYSLPASFTYLPQKEELYHMYQDSGWSILEYRESAGHLHKQDESGRQISGLFSLLLAQKL
ncbi:tellurite resistance protein TehB [Legionella birminghamensis]|uniref:Tellurite resistance protein TehB n=1 Tax=Legionella birminghamensis TaxID=28083 RepID=A0A378IA56_9GAMM|nr:SAM-dependent methyltransferase TehB [Legionella birminghamensis]KTC75992.1 tellurite resistance protein TehB [Legionella birminghamensis]STX32118.1 tellurite resistance protein TehB [Legionella birminghamensis]